jgi:lipoprotein-releasing system ATP-binding protein
MDALLVAHSVSKSYPSKEDGDPVQVLDKVNFEIRAGESVAVTGPSGSGKSTLLHVLGGLDRPDQGHITFGGQDLRGMNSESLAKWRNRHLGFVFQFHYLLPEFSAIENVMMPALIQGQDNKETESRARILMERIGLVHRLHHRPSELSGGEQQRVAVARAIMNKPSLLMADEPTGNLDEQNTLILMDLLRSMCKTEGMALILVTHDLQLTQYCDRTFTLSKSVVPTY